MSRLARGIKEHSASPLLLLLGADLSLLLLHIAAEVLHPASSTWNGAVVWDIIEIYQIAKLAAILILFASVARSSACSGYTAWMSLFAFFLVDEALQIHQRLGDYIGLSLGLPSRLLEVGVLALVLALFSAIILRAYLRGPHEFREISKDLLLLIVLWVFFGFFTDLVELSRAGRVVEFASDFVEDGGEMATVSLILWYVFFLALHKGKPEWFLRDLLRKPLDRHRA